MKIYLTNFAKHRQIIDAGIIPISLVKKPPSGCLYEKIDCLVYEKRPKAQHFSREDIAAYKGKVLSKADAQEVMKELMRFEGKDVALMCFSSKGEKSLRRMVSEWLESSLGVKSEEMEFKQEIYQYLN